MKRRLMAAACLIWVAMFVAIGGISAQEEDVEASPQEIKEAQETARRFVNCMLETRDVAALFDELFLKDFTSHFVSDETVHLSLYSRLARRERERLFAATYNLSYLSSVAIKSEYDDFDIVAGERKSNPRLLLPRSTLLKLRRALRVRKDEENRITGRGQLRVFLPLMEEALAEARTYLHRIRFEQSTEFQRELASHDELGHGVEYRVRAYIGGQNVKDCELLIGFPANQKFFRVELPLYIGAILIKDGAGMKIVRLTYVDGD